ncbi:MAG: hypothetical protein KKF54_00915 [Candidatus Omnitrophica bacterium]|nr:hypothetical protein [Candidatus Omnitrophota bacterium]
MRIDLKQEIIKLVELQKIDSQIYALTRKKDIDNPIILSKIKNEFQEKAKILEEFEISAKETQINKKEKELDLATKEAAISKSNTQLYQLKTNKEYQAKLSEISSLKADISVLEDAVLTVLEKIEQAQAQLKKQREKVAQYEKESKEKENEILNEQKEIEIQLKIAQDKRGKISRDVDKAILSKYERLLNSRSGLALAPVNHDSCGACFLRTNHKTINEIKMYKDLIFCDSCVRILYIPEDIEG